ncbi:sugar transferase [Blautia wexlerae]|uniref:Exopolysaccharide biosynthesis polyprenyl glycosylphosphotransferase n=1 Tax=Blautia wexlerae TaxID=418240 RepID=A0A6L8T0I2_9FIRM|nr:sugar transferase [Blautia wexlerae]MZL33059.1 exopolysaccharide biosynthesis polyprenyl glycosylphosphotransferase [Blautia wexlerae]MZT15046.1 exopolysaccharide biosynthesis polyprenyl glycosylphosphotransferase [Blautia wexlerae]MZT33236.1 exopolysaccharide biosynthesis polyprenyl glycosylphosphotransferase [Blautia wexlerae]MZT40919.1 exopolysaccharide biosynthesis polyprenyl glycosylphosphotransferase [Blautia wexlerae]MZT47508.1 exopolysaccharide biosynthesis polyprenyl glycosylphosph
MYRQKSKGWYKHKDFIFMDLCCIVIAFILADWFRHEAIINLYTDEIYRNTIIFIVLLDLCVSVVSESYKGVLKRGYYLEFNAVLKQTIIAELGTGLYLFSIDNGHNFSRIVLYLMGIIYTGLTYLTRILWKKHLKSKMAEEGEHSLYIVTNENSAEDVIRNVRENNYNLYDINGLVIIDKDMTGSWISGIPVVAELKDASAYICQKWVDEVFINVDEDYPFPQELMDELLEMGMVVHRNLAKIKSMQGQRQMIETVGGYTVLTTSMNFATDRQAFAKRTLDIVGGLVGCILTGIIYIFIGPAIYISSPGPIFFSQVRIGQNGKPFKMYKFRSMYMDAEERKAELMAQNKMSDGRMFKLDFDPRVIGNKILPDGRKKTGVGEFIRKTSLDEFPQFWNVLKGDMSLVGTRPILQDELEQYELHHRARIATKPGITGMWQVSGRSNITDFEEVVRLDTEYITKWNFGLDIKILLQTVKTVLKREGTA